MSYPYNCAGKVQRQNRNDHITSFCENRMVTCEHCNKDMQAKLLEAGHNTSVNHLVDCPKNAIACPHCGVRKAISEAPYHIQQECDQVEVQCPFYLLGCSISMMQHKVEEHLTLAGSSHMKQLCHAVVLLSHQLGKAHMICTRPPKITYESQELIQSGSLKSATDRNLSDSSKSATDPNQSGSSKSATDPNQSGSSKSATDPNQSGSSKSATDHNQSNKCSMEVYTCQSPNFSEFLVSQLHRLKLEKTFTKKEEVNLITNPETTSSPINSLDSGQFTLACSHFLNSSQVSSSDAVQHCTPFLSKSPGANILVSQTCNSSHTSTTTSTLVDHDSESPNYSMQDFGNGNTGNTCSDMIKIMTRMCSEFKVNELVMHDKFQELHSRFTSLEEINSGLAKVVNNLEQHVVKTSAKLYNGDFCWCINGFSLYRLKLDAGESSMLHSSPFYTNPWGYKMCVRANIDKCSGKEQLSLFVHLMRGKNDEFLPWPFSGKITICVVDQNPDSSKRTHAKETLESNPNWAAFLRPITPRNHKGFGYINFLSISEIENSTFLMNDTLVIRTQVFSNCQ